MARNWPKRMEDRRGEDLALSDGMVSKKTFSMRCRSVAPTVVS